MQYTYIYFPMQQKIINKSAQFSINIQNKITKNAIYCKRFRHSWPGIYICWKVFAVLHFRMSDALKVFKEQLGKP